MDIWIFVPLYFPCYVCPFNLSPIQIYEESNALYLSSKSQFLPISHSICIYGPLFTRLFSIGQPVPGTSGMVRLRKGRCNYIEDFHTMIVLLFLEIAIFCKSESFVCRSVVNKLSKYSDK